jgi:hypothetical protein
MTRGGVGTFSVVSLVVDEQAPNKLMLQTAMLAVTIIFKAFIVGWFLPNQRSHAPVM